MRSVTFKPQKGQSPNTTITLPTGLECKFNGGKYETADPGTIEWLHKLGYEPYQAPGRPKKKTAKK